MLGDEFLFIVADQSSGPALWKTSGTPDSTQLVREFDASSPTLNHKLGMTVRDDKVYFTFDGTRWSSDGTSSGTTGEVIQGNASHYVSAGENLIDVAGFRRYVVAGDKVIYLTTEPGPLRDEVQLLRSTNGTQIDTLLEFGTDSRFDFDELLHFNGLTYFVVLEHFHEPRRERFIWTTDGTKENTTRFLSIGNTQSSNLLPAGDTLFFNNDGNLWKTDGTTAGTALVKENRGPSTFSVASIGNDLYFAHQPISNDVPGRTQLWVSDGTETGTVQISNVVPSRSIGFGETVFAGIGDVLIFRTETERGNQLWAYDSKTGQSDGLLEPLKGESSNPIGLTQLNESEFVFVATNDAGRNELWKSNGKTTEFVLTIPDPSLDETDNIEFVEFVYHNGEVYFLQGYIYSLAPGDWQTSYDLWKTDGTPSGTTRLKQHAFTVFEELDGPFDSPLLEFEDGTPKLIARPTTWAVQEPEPGVYRVERKDFFFEAVGYNGSDLAGLWVREKGEERFLGEFESVSNPTQRDIYLYFEVDGQLWKTDGTVVGTQFERNRSESEIEFADVGGKQFFASTTDDSSLWVSENGNERLVATFENAISNLTAFSDDLLYFVADDGIHGSEVWQSDGTTKGTVLAADVLPGPLDSLPSGLVSVGDSVYFAAEDGVHGREVWRLQNQTQLPGDVDGDGFVTFSDFLVLSNNFGKPTEQGNNDGDIDGSGIVDFTDFLILSANFGR